MSADFLIYIAAFLGVLGILVTFHEFGHYIVARWSGVQVMKFSVGFGRALWSYTDQRGTEFAVAAIPFGGFVRMLDDRDPEQAEQLKPGQVAYMDLHPAWRIAIALGGPFANFILAILVFWVLLVSGVMNLVPMVKTPGEETPLMQAGISSPAMLLAVDGRDVRSWSEVGLALTERLGETGTIEIDYFDLRSASSKTAQVQINKWHQGVGEPDVIDSLGIVPARLSVVGGVEPGTAAAAAGLRINDWIVSADDRPVGDWGDLVNEIQAHPDQSLTLGVYRGGNRIDVPVKPVATPTTDGDTVGTLGVSSPLIEVSSGMFAAVPAAVGETWDKTLMTLGIIKKMFTGQVSVKNLSGPISIAQIAGDSARYSWRSFFNILAFLSISLGVLNLLPIPILDGGQVIYNGAEWVMGKPVPESIQILGVQVGLLLVGTMLIFATYNDILRLFN